MKKDKPRSNPESTTISTLLGRDTEFEGTLAFKETIRVDGRIKGRLISSDGTVIVGEHAVIDADIAVAVAVIRGKINGRVEATQRIEVFPPAHIIGDICAPVVAIESGVHFNGTCQMTDPSSKTAQPVPQASEPPAAAAGEPEKNTKNH